MVAGRHGRFLSWRSFVRVGTFRQATVGRQRYEEYIVAWDEGRRWPYYIDRATVPIATAQLECTEFEDDGRGTRLHWTVAHERREYRLWKARDG